MELSLIKWYMTPRAKSTRRAMRLYLLVSLPMAVILPFIAREFGYEPLQVFLAILLLEVCLYPTARYFAHKDSGLPTLPIFCLAYALQFALPIFTREATIELVGAEIKYIQDTDVVAALIMAIVGICAFQVGYHWFEQSRFKQAVPIARLHLNKSKAVLFCALVGLLLPLLFTLRSIIPEEYQQPLSAILRLLQNQGFVVIGVLGWIVYGRKSSWWYTLWLYGLVIITAVRGVSTGTLEEALLPIGVLFLVKWYYTRRISFVLITGVLGIVLFLSPVKADFRQQIWYGEAAEAAEMSSAAKVLFWVDQATEYWKDTLSGSRGIVEATSSATGRGDFIHQVAYIYSMTPSVVSYQYGATYSYFLVAIVPRIIWPDKPVAGTANGFYAVNYGITTQEGTKSTTFGVSILGEAFINFGWYGVALLFILQGLIISLLESIFAGPKSGPGGQAVFIAFFVFFLNGIGSSTEIMFGGILQNLLCGYFLLLWAREKPAKLRTVHLPLAIGQRT